MASLRGMEIVMSRLKAFNLFSAGLLVVLLSFALGIWADVIAPSPGMFGMMLGLVLLMPAALCLLEDNWRAEGFVFSGMMVGSFVVGYMGFSGEVSVSTLLKLSLYVVLCVLSYSTYSWWIRRHQMRRQPTYLPRVKLETIRISQPFRLFDDGAKAAIALAQHFRMNASFIYGEDEVEVLEKDTLQSVRNRYEAERLAQARLAELARKAGWQLPEE